MPDYDIFISYASEETDWVREHLYDPLLRCRTADGRPPRVFFDKGELNIEVGTDFMDALIRAVYTSRFVVPVYSTTYFGKGPCIWELGRSHEFFVCQGQPQLVPILKEPDAIDRIPLKVSNIEYLSASAPDWFPRLSQKFGLVATADRLSLDFLDQPPPEVTADHTLPAIHVRARRTVGALAAEVDVSLSLQEGELGGTATVKTEKGVATFADLSVRTPSASTRLVASAQGCEGVASTPFTVARPKVRVVVEQTAPLIREPGHAVFFGSGPSIAVLGPHQVSVFDVQGSRLGDPIPGGGRIRRVTRSASMLALTDWSGTVTAVCEDGRGRGWAVGARSMGLNIPGSLAIDGTDLVVGFWSGEVYRLPFEGEPITQLRHAAGVQALAVCEGRLCIAGLDGSLTLYSGGTGTPAQPLEATVHLLKSYPGCMVAVGDSRLFHLRLDSLALFDERLPFGRVAAVLDDARLPVVMDAQGRGLRFDAELLARVRFHARPGAVPVSSTTDGRQCVCVNPDGSRALVVGEQIVFTHPGGTLAVAPDGSYVALGDERGISILDRVAFDAVLRSEARE